MVNLPAQKKRAPANRTLYLTQEEVDRLSSKNFVPAGKMQQADVVNKVIHSDIYDIVEYLPDNFVDLMFIDPPYNLTKSFNTSSFSEMKSDQYENWIDSWLSKLIRLLKRNASIYICSEWNSSSAVFNTAQKYFRIRNRITWEREKGRGALKNWKNCHEDIWFCTLSDDYYFNVEAVKMKRKVIAPYKKDGQPKDWLIEDEKGYRITHPSNIWTDISVPFWSMPENTDHPTQKPEKLIAKIILASSKQGDVVFDPFLGSGTTAATAKKTSRLYCGVEKDLYYCCLAQKRLELADIDKSIQGYDGEVFWERNTLNERRKK